MDKIPAFLLAFHYCVELFDYVDEFWPDFRFYLGENSDPVDIDLERAQSRKMHWLTGLAIDIESPIIGLDFSYNELLRRLTFDNLGIWDLLLNLMCQLFVIVQIFDLVVMRVPTV